ncbi:MAG: hypothetical protein JJ899_08820 [Alphaproteobacteria bacterium]|nr:hypothetical protein [Alphaproteobacteria bacterium]
MVRAKTDMGNLVRLAGGAALIAVMLQAGAPALAQGAADWSPEVSERLMKLPGDHLRRAVDNDFARSAMAERMAALDEQVALKRATLGDLQRAAQQAGNPELRIELQHEFLNEKRNFLRLMEEKQELRRQRAEKKLALFEGLLDRMTRKRRATTPQQAAIVANQTAARERFESSMSKVDARLLQTAVTSESRYAAEYAKNVRAVEQLVAAINAHPMNQAPAIDGQTFTREEYLRQLVAQAQGQLAIVDQERMILGHMAKLVSLDALALAEGISERTGETEVAARAERNDELTSSIDLFTTR